METPLVNVDPRGITPLFFFFLLKVWGNFHMNKQGFMNPIERQYKCCEVSFGESWESMLCNPRKSPMGNSSAQGFLGSMSTSLPELPDFALLGLGLDNFGVDPLWVCPRNFKGTSNKRPTTLVLCDAKSCAWLS